VEDEELQEEVGAGPPSELADSIRAVHTSKRRPDTSGAIEARVAAERNARLAAGEPEGHKLKPVGANVVPKRKPRAFMEDALPLSPGRAAGLGITSILPPMRVKNDKKFQKFLFDITQNPDLRAECPTWASLAERFGVSVSTIKTWLLSDEVAKAMETAVSHEAKMRMPSVIRAVRVRAEVTGDPHAAEFLRKIAKMGTAETDASKSFESTLRQIAAARASETKALPAPVRVIEAQSLPERLTVDVDVVDSEETGGSR
jgi:hypothetical protein